MIIKNTKSEGDVEIVLWGESNVGKTTALAAYFCDRERLPDWVEPAHDSTRKSQRELEHVWKAIDSNRLPGGTVSFRSYEFAHSRTGRLVKFRDMRGGNSGKPDAAEDLTALRNADAAMIFLTWPLGDGNVDQIFAARSAIRNLREGSPRALLLTKVECHLRRAELAEIAIGDPVAAARRRGFSESFLDLVTALRDAVFPVSVFGYHDDGLPAQYRDEFGRLVPWKIKPLNIQPSFDYILSHLQLL